MWPLDCVPGMKHPTVHGAGALLRRLRFAVRCVLQCYSSILLFLPPPLIGGNWIVGSKKNKKVTTRAQ